MTGLTVTARKSSSPRSPLSSSPQAATPGAEAIIGFPLITATASGTTIAYKPDAG
jgi:hypothetical protein